MLNTRNFNRDNRIVGLRNKGYTFEKIGKEVGLTRQRTSQIYHKNAEQDHLLTTDRWYSTLYSICVLEGWWVGVATRAYNILKYNDLLDSDIDLRDISDEELLSYRSCGLRVLELIRLADDAIHGRDALV